MGNFIDLTGKQFGRLIVIERAESNKPAARWLCKCECGNTKIVRGCDLKNGHTQSCGCLHKEVVTEILNTTCNKHTHGKRRTRLYNIWSSMKARCFYEHNKAFKYYGGRGITICEEWKDNFQAFYDWAMVNGYDDKLTIDRIDVNGNYEPSNCRWATMKEQANNKRRQRIDNAVFSLQ